MSAGHDHDMSKVDRNLKIGIALNTGFTIFEFITGFLSGSLALVSDAGHNLTDSLSLVISYSANQIANRRANEDKTYGYGRATILAALINATILVALACYIFYESYQRILHPEPVQGGIVAIVALLGALTNGANALLFLKNREDINIRSAFIGMAFDALASVGALVAGLVIIWTGQTIADPIASIIIGVLLLAGTWNVAKDALHILLEGVPAGINTEDVKAYMLQTPLIKNVDDLHIWAISSQYAALSCHVVIEDCDLPRSMAIVQKVKQELRDKYHIDHATIETELTECPPTTSPQAF